MKLDIACVSPFPYISPMTIDRTNVRRILIIQPRGIGDIVLTTVTIGNLRADFPGAVIDYLIQKPLHRAFLDQPFINEVLTFSRNDFLSGFRLIREVRKRRYDLIIDFFSNPRTAFITRFSGAKYRAGRPYPGRRYAYNLQGPIHAYPGPMHQAERHLYFLETLGLSHSDTSLQFSINENDRIFAEKFWSETFESNAFVVGLLPCGSWPSKKCNPEKLAEIADEIQHAYGAHIFLIWGPEEREESQRISELMKRPLVMAPPTTVGEMAAMLAKCSMAVANDSGPMHIATALGTPVLALHGPTSPGRQGPFGKAHEAVRIDGLDCIACHLKICPRNHECFRSLPLSQVHDAVDRIISKNRLAVPDTTAGE